MCVVLSISWHLLLLNTICLSLTDIALKRPAVLERESTLETFKRGIPEPAAYSYQMQPSFEGTTFYLLIFFCEFRTPHYCFVVSSLLIIADVGPCLCVSLRRS